MYQSMFGMNVLTRQYPRLASLLPNQLQHVFHSCGVVWKSQRWFQTVVGRLKITSMLAQILHSKLLTFAKVISPSVYLNTKQVILNVRS